MTTWGLKDTSSRPAKDLGGTLRHTLRTMLRSYDIRASGDLYLAGHENSKTTMDIYAKVKYNKPEELFGVVNGAFHQAIAE